MAKMQFKPGMILRLTASKLGPLAKDDIAAIIRVDPGTEESLDDDQMWSPSIVTVLIDGEIVDYTGEYLRRTAEIVEETNPWTH
jgi:hypothetical protein